MSIEALKEQARRHEHREEWRKALDQYKKAIAKLDAEDQPDIGLYNRVGDLFVRIGDLDDAVKHYERAVDLYMEAGLPNNAIAVLKKVIRNVPQRHDAILRMGQVRAAQGFFPDARANFVRYAELMQQAGDLDESLRALVEFCDLAPDDVALRRAVADQMASHERIPQAVEQLVIAYRHLMRNGDDDEAATFQARIGELDPEMDLEVPAVAPDDDFIGTFGQVDFSDEVAADSRAGEDEDVRVESGSFAAGDSLSGAGPGYGESAGEDASPQAIDPSAQEDVAGAEAEEAEDDLVFLDAEPQDVEGEGGAEKEAAGELPLLEPDLTGPAREVVEEDQDLVFSELGSHDLDEGDEDEGEPDALPFLEVGIYGEDEAEAPLETVSIDEDAHEEDAAVAWQADDAEVAAGAEDDVAGAGTSAEEAIEAAMEEARAEVEPRPEAEPHPEAEPPSDVGLQPQAELQPEAQAKAPASMGEIRLRITEHPDDVTLRQRLVELAYREGDETDLADAYMGLGEALQRGGLPARAKAAFQQVLQINPGHQGAQAALGAEAAPPPPVREVASHEDYVDLGSLILGDEAEKTTRFIVAYEEPSGDEAADFAKMLDQFKEQVSKNLDADDVKAHHDLGTAYMEMGLLDEAVSEFQKALRASADHLATYELLGQAFIEMGRYDAAVRSLKRALEVPYQIEDDLVGIYYYLARAYEGTGNKESALEFYDRVFSLDINFADVTERLKALR